MPFDVAVEHAAESPAARTDSALRLGVVDADELCLGDVDGRVGPGLAPAGRSNCLDGDARIRRAVLRGDHQHVHQRAAGQHGDLVGDGLRVGDGIVDLTGWLPGVAAVGRAREPGWYRVLRV